MHSNKKSETIKTVKIKTIQTDNPVDQFRPQIYIKV